MQIKTFLLASLIPLGICSQNIQAQESIPATGGNASGSGGSVSYSIGQMVYTTISGGSNGSVAQGVQQAYEISIVNQIIDTKGIDLNVLAFPNPTNTKLQLIIQSKEMGSMYFELYDITGKLLLKEKIYRMETSISLENYTSSCYFLKIFQSNVEVKTFKIIKN